MLLPCGFLPAPLRADDNVDDNMQVTLMPTPEESDEGDLAENLSPVEVDTGGEPQYTTMEAPEQTFSQSQTSLNPDAPEFISGQTDLSDIDTEVSPASSQVRPQRRKVPPTYLSDYQLGFKAHCRHHSLCQPTQQTLFHGFLMSLQQQIAGLVQSLASCSDGDVTF